MIEEDAGFCGWLSFGGRAKEEMEKATLDDELLTSLSTGKSEKRWSEMRFGKEGAIMSTWLGLSLSFLILMRDLVSLHTLFEDFAFFNCFIDYSIS